MSDETQQPIRLTPVKFCSHCSTIWQALEDEKDCANCGTDAPPIYGLFTDADADTMLNPPAWRETGEEGDIL
jgi:hypothetical protein